jgi:hypothetical protein
MAKTRQDLHPIEDWDLDWVVTGSHVVDEPDQPFRDYHTILWAQRIWFPSPPPNYSSFIVVYTREQAHGLALILAANPGLLIDMCMECHWPYYRLIHPRWESIKPPQPPLPYLTWPDDHRAPVPACISWDFTWSWNPDPPYPYD